jgi:hypothetical protein
MYITLTGRGGIARLPRELREQSSAVFPVCCISGFPTREPSADLAPAVERGSLTRSSFARREVPQAAGDVLEVRTCCGSQTRAPFVRQRACCAKHTRSTSLGSGDRAGRRRHPTVTHGSLRKATVAYGNQKRFFREGESEGRIRANQTQSK